MPSSATYRAKFRRMYLDAKEMQMVAMEDEIQEIADDTSQDFMIQGGKMVPNRANIAQAKLRITTKQWMMGRLAARNKEMPEGEEKKRQWFKLMGYYVDMADDGGSFAAWEASMYDKWEAEQKAKEAAREAAGLEPEPRGQEPAYTPIKPEDVIELQPDELVWDDDPDVMAERLAALKEKYLDVPRLNETDEE